MSTDSIQLKRDDVTRKKMLSWGMEPFIESFLLVAYNYLIFYYYEVELGLATALVGLSFVIFAIWNMINDPLIGYLTDRPFKWTKKYGMRTPWALLGGVLLIITYYFLYAVPQTDVKTNPWPLFWYMIIVTCLFDTFFSLFTTNAVASFGMIFRNMEERRKGSTLAIVVGLMGRTLLVAVIIPITIVLGDPSSYIRSAIISCIILSIALVLFIPGVYENEFVKERYLKIYEILGMKKISYFKFLKTTFKQKNYMVFTITYAIFQAANFLQVVSMIYYLNDIHGYDLSILAYVSIAFILTFLPFMFIWSWVAKKTAHSNLSIIGTILVGLVFLSLVFATEVIHLVLINALGGIGTAAYIGVILSMISDANDEVVDACGTHVEAGLIGIQNFFLRATFMISGIIIAAVHIATGYVAGAAEQTELAKTGILIHTGVIPFLMLMVSAFLMIKFYDLKGEKKEQLMARLRKKGLR